MFQLPQWPSVKSFCVSAFLRRSIFSRMSFNIKMNHSRASVVLIRWVFSAVFFFFFRPTWHQKTEGMERISTTEFVTPQNSLPLFKDKSDPFPYSFLLHGAVVLRNCWNVSGVFPTLLPCNTRTHTHSCTHFHSPDSWRPAACRLTHWLCQSRVCFSAKIHKICRCKWEQEWRPHEWRRCPAATFHQPPSKGDSRLNLQKQMTGYTSTSD